ncbi:lung adenoma susceptibility protein 2 [Cyclopterus lumpus]|uniref:Lung adenoma susceptibility protein 2 n=1 Tax=Cyclopterus lumpus TaxID=8103 RepID=A0A8C3B0W2_CYCLU|nr:lung adenoma susceptibility protein 2 [Cyclopterus lumpus]XP_034402814.1 lung adenoma susceptibility protein 2 [Cyclopterus lumpus]XP_034402815.1 lung adenoma susceptibility protein 2 [Cyclopterus lumpus]XP_034402816.1 lung adenoma susceptibility protein 2 [Cyclopterus lumpus]
MEASGLVGVCLSPESTVTSLLSSSGHLRSSLLGPDHNTTFRYRHKDYESASAALDAYIRDFERSRRHSAPLTGRLLLPQRPPSTPSRPRVSTLRNRDVLKERLTDRELDFLNLPVSSLHHRSNRDRLSMTTDELLSIPYDGSMPVTHTSAFIQGLLSQSGSSEPCFSSSRPAHIPWDRLSSSHGAPQLNHHHLHPPRSSRCRERPVAATLNPHVDVSSVSCHRPSAHRAAGSEWAAPSSSLHLPRWFTSNKTDMDCSGITSVPDLKYPAWVHRCDLSETPPPTESEQWDEHGVPTAPRNGAPSWVAALEGDDPDQTPAQVDSQQALQDLGLQFAEQISLLAAERRSSDVMDTLFRDNRIESLIQKADQVLNSLSLSSGEVDGPADPVSLTDCVEEAVSPVTTEELLLCPRSHRRLFPWGSAAASGSATEAPPFRGAQAWVSSLPENNLFKQPGPVEALKQMLFRLQAVEAELQRRQPASGAPTLLAGLQTVEAPVQQRPEAQLERVPGGPSLQRAMHHLSRLKVLVEEPREKRVEEKERDEDEGRYSSSSADGLICTPQKPS